MTSLPETLMILREELAKEKLENKRLRQEYREQIKHLSAELDRLKTTISSQERVIQNVRQYAFNLESELNQFRQRVGEDLERNRNGYH